MSKPKYEVGDYVRIKNIHIDDDYPSGVTDDMLDFANKLARITDIRGESYQSYQIDLDNGKWDWDEDMFEYRLGNYDDNVKSDFVYVIGYVHKNVTHEFKGKVVDFNSDSKSTFIDNNGKILILPYKDIAYILPIED